jgi:CubicO group peptidase (beta-lactamase class C family)
MLKLRFLWLSMAAFLGSGAVAQPKPNIAGDYAGTLGPLHLKLHIVAAPDGALTGTLDSTDQGASGIPCQNFQFDGHSLSFSVPAVRGAWKGTVGDDGALSGTWDQGTPLPLRFARNTFTAAAKPSPVDGVWLGTLHSAGQPLRAQIKVKSDNTGREYCALDSVDQHAFDWECANVRLAGSDFAFDVTKVQGHWSGKLSEDGKTLAGTWTQGTSQPLNFERQATALTAGAPALDPAMAPVDAAGLEAVLERDLAPARVETLKLGALAPGTSAGIAIGVVAHGVRRVFVFGTAAPDSMFEIGSVSKTFTALILAEMVGQGKVKFDDPVREFLPEGTVAKPAGAEITLLDLAIQHSGLPRMPDNFHPADPANPYADYGPTQLYAFLSKQGVAKPANPPFLYSNLGVGLLGQALANRAGASYPNLLAQEVTGPLALKETTISLSPEQQRRFIPGHDAEHRPAHAWDLVALAGAGGIRSTAGDMLTYLEAQLHPEKLSNPKLAAALAETHELRADAAPGLRIGLVWLYETDTGTYWHNGATGGYSSYVFFNPKGDYAAVVLSNTSIGGSGSFADLLGHHIAQRLAGKPAVSLAF